MLSENKENEYFNGMIGSKEPAYRTAAFVLRCSWDAKFKAGRMKDFWANISDNELAHVDGKDEPPCSSNARTNMKCRIRRKKTPSEVEQIVKKYRTEKESTSISPLLAFMTPRNDTNTYMTPSSTYRTPSMGSEEAHARCLFPNGNELTGMFYYVLQVSCCASINSI